MSAVHNGTQKAPVVHCSTFVAYERWVFMDGIIWNWFLETSKFLMILWISLLVLISNFFQLYDTQINKNFTFFHYWVKIIAENENKNSAMKFIACGVRTVKFPFNATPSFNSTVERCLRSDKLTKFWLYDELMKHAKIFTSKKLF